MAAGKAERLKGIVDDVPKPMIEVAGKPVLEHNIEWLRSFGISDIYINLHHLPDVIRDYFGDDGRWDVNITYSYEQELLGTAGAVRKIANDYWSKESQDNSGDEKAFVLVYGDNLLSDFDLNKIIEFHKAKRAIATICLYHKDEVSQSGIAVMDSENRIVKFVEKPGPGEAISNLVNTGVYVLEAGILDYIPENQFSDFGRDVFPEVIRAGEGLYGIVLEANLVAIDTPELLEKAARGRAER